MAMLVSGKPQHPHKYCTLCGLQSNNAALLHCPNDGGLMQFVELADAYGKFLMELRLHALLYGVTFSAVQLNDLYGVEASARKEYAAYVKGEAR